MPKHDNLHFNDYTRQNEVKHRILKQYLPAYFRALKNIVNCFHYVDGFSGPGEYAGGVPGSPILAIEKIEEAGLLQKTTLSFVDNSKKYYEALSEKIVQHRTYQNFMDEPFIKHGNFHDHIETILSKEVLKYKKVATFSFIDPCGVDGVRIQDLCRLLSLPFGEVLLFFNYDGINRILGGISSGEHDKRVLVELFGSELMVDDLLLKLSNVNSPSEKEHIIRDYFIGSLRSLCNIRYFVPFRVENPVMDRTSHYLVHCCNNCLGFKMMKHVMWEASTKQGSEYSGLEFLNDDELGRQFTLFKHDIDNQKQKIVDTVSMSPCKVSLFKKDWVCKPNDAFSEGLYSKMLLDLEADGRILVYDRNNKEVAPVSKRRKSQGKPTIGDDYWIRVGD